MTMSFCSKSDNLSCYLIPSYRFFRYAGYYL
jgi:hypothetical protein